MLAPAGDEDFAYCGMFDIPVDLRIHSCPI